MLIILTKVMITTLATKIMINTITIAVITVLVSLM